MVVVELFTVPKGLLSTFSLSSILLGNHHLRRVHTNFDLRSFESTITPDLTDDLNRVITEIELFSDRGTLYRVPTIDTQ